MKKISAAEFKTHCLSIMDDVNEKQESVIVTKHGKPVIKVIPYAKSSEKESNPLEDSIIFQKDIVSPVGVEWEAGA